MSAEVPTDTAHKAFVMVFMVPMIFIACLLILPVLEVPGMMSGPAVSLEQKAFLLCAVSICLGMVSMLQATTWKVLKRTFFAFGALMSYGGVIGWIYLILILHTAANG